MFFMEDDDDSYDDSYYSDSYLYDTDDDYHYNPNSPLLRERMQWLKVSLYRLYKIHVNQKLYYEHFYSTFCDRVLNSVSKLGRTSIHDTKYLLYV